MPLGIHLPSGVLGAIDKGKQFPLQLQACNRRGCIAKAKVDDNLKKALVAGKGLAISFSAQPNADPQVLNVALAEISSGLDAIGVTSGAWPFGS